MRVQFRDPNARRAFWPYAPYEPDPEGLRAREAHGSQEGPRNVNSLFLITVASINNALLMGKGWKPGLSVHRKYGAFVGPSFELGGLEVYSTRAEADKEIEDRLSMFVGVTFTVREYGLVK